jgi:hypothetical protein
VGNHAERVADAGGPCVPEPDGVTPVGFKRRADVPTIGAMW